jgi:ATP-dependent RNA helicase DBP3
MPKRSLDDAGLVAGGEPAVEVFPQSKKSRKEKRQCVNDTEASTPDVIATEDGNTVESKAARKEKKRLKKLKKAEEAAAEATKQKSNSNGEAEDEKGAKNAEKARLKALKKAKKQEDSTSPEETDTATNNVFPTNSHLASNHHSSQVKKGNLDRDQSYTEDANLTALPQTEIDEFLLDNFIAVTDPLSASSTLRPITKFSFLPISDPAQRAPFKDFQAPTPIQAVAWPFLFAGRDVIGVAETGSGKTMAFAVPCVRAISFLPKSQKNKGAKAVIVSPTRELAMQSYEQITKLASVSGLMAVCVYGGVPKDEQRKALKTADIVVATPGRLNDLINEGYADLSGARYVVLDEADRMLDKGFEEEIRKIINTTPPRGERQTLMFTATWPESVRTLASTFMTNPVKIAIGGQ